MSALVVACVFTVGGCRRIKPGDAEGGGTTSSTVVVRMDDGSEVQVLLDPAADAAAPGYSVVRAKDGHETQVRLGRGPMPAEFPPDVPLYPGAELTATVRTATSVVVTFSTSGAVDAMYAFYVKQPGYEQLSDVVVDGSRVLQVRQVASGKDFQVIVKLDGSRTETSLVAPLR
jgi:hypothetical protein